MLLVRQDQSNAGTGMLVTFATPALISGRIPIPATFLLHERVRTTTRTVVFHSSH